ncbi:hypothetical protein I302_106291 [Kwoniella bestiolae CBS 10118]|uniref:Uncharacterized protein n=1 Tax=Kwoniella bestiolae CBS 10118 TaxID=1296100 RepID=A0A1B9G3J6_9TREE|nr:hypothetical protein I302_05414 [Kwoniella bestiolae CBS 10118]OCF25594.1 hypothetical protein I302_05414 [Kwoniella bestiolae CBS 10118]
MIGYTTTPIPGTQGEEHLDIHLNTDRLEAAYLADVGSGTADADQSKLLTEFRGDLLRGLQDRLQPRMFDLILSGNTSVYEEGTSAVTPFAVVRQLARCVELFTSEGCFKRRAEEANSRWGEKCRKRAILDVEDFLSHHAPFHTF